jgi:hypothetical protein
MWSRSLDNEALAHWGLLRHWENKYLQSRRDLVPLTRGIGPSYGVEGRAVTDGTRQADTTTRWAVRTTKLLDNQSTAASDSTYLPTV